MIGRRPSLLHRPSAIGGGSNSDILVEDSESIVNMMLETKGKSTLT